MINVIFLIGSLLLLVIIMIGVIQVSRKIRTKMVICFFLISLIPVIPLVFVINGIIEKSLKIGVNKEIVDTLENAKVLVEEVLSKEKEKVIRKAIHLSKNPFLIPKNHDAELLDTNIEDPIVKKALSQKKPFAIVCGENDEMVKGIAPVFEDGEIKGIVVVSSTLGEDFISSTQKIKDSLKFYSSINLLRVPIGEGYLIIFVFIAFLMVAVAFLTGYIISKKLTTPLKSLIKGLEEVGVGNLDYEVKAETKDEMARTITSFNKMVKELKDSRKLLIEAEREAAWRGIAQKIAHEIKGPLTPIQLSLQHLQDKYYEDPKAYENVLKDCTRRINEEVDALRKMANEFSEFARMPEPSFEYTDVNKILEDTVSLFAQVKPEIKINPTYGLNLPRIRLDRERMKRVFKNIIQNGIDALGDEGEIKIKSSANPQFLKIEFQDTGMGMDEETIKKIFTPYFSTKSHGMGLGLPIVDKIIHEHRGKIEVKSQPDKGTTFIILLPVKSSE
ncbi:MAG: ATP-binding protein [bacterium]